MFKKIVLTALLTATSYNIVYCAALVQPVKNVSTDSPKKGEVWRTSSLFNNRFGKKKAVFCEIVGSCKDVWGIDDIESLIREPKGLLGIPALLNYVIACLNDPRVLISYLHGNCKNEIVLGQLKENCKGQFFM
ncbi:MAG: hypothetical protein WCT20_00285 [Candidatus Babeliales bacterium]